MRTRHHAPTDGWQEGSQLIHGTSGRARWTNLACPRLRPSRTIAFAIAGR